MKENGFAIGLLAGTLVLGGGLVALGMKQGSRYSDALANYEDIKSDVEKMASVKPFPSQENKEQRKKDVTAYLGKVGALQEAIQAYAPKAAPAAEGEPEVEAMPSISPSELQNRLVAKVAAITELFNKRDVIFPGQFAYGMESYVAGLPNKGATAKLNYQLEATDWLLRQMSEAGIWELKNFTREALPSEAGGDWMQRYKQDRQREIPFAQSMPLEITFLGDEASLNQVLNILASSKEYFFAIDMVRMANSNPNAPVRSQSGLEEEEFASAASDEGFGEGFGDFNFGDESEEGEASAEVAEDTEDAVVVDTGRILGQVAGSEGIWVGLQLRLLLYTEPFALPEIK